MPLYITRILFARVKKRLGKLQKKQSNEQKQRKKQESAGNQIEINRFQQERFILGNPLIEFVQIFPERRIFVDQAEGQGLVRKNFFGGGIFKLAARFRVRKEEQTVAGGFL